VVASETPPTSTTLELTNPEPEIVRVSALDPAGALAGLMEEIASAGGVVPPVPLPVPVPFPEPPLELLPPQPVINNVKVLVKTKERKQTNKGRNRPSSPMLTAGPFFPLNRVRIFGRNAPIKIHKEAL
jgi:hypothetical protein